MVEYAKDHRPAIGVEEALRIRHDVTEARSNLRRMLGWSSYLYQHEAAMLRQAEYVLDRLAEDVQVSLRQADAREMMRRDPNDPADGCAPSCRD